MRRILETRGRLHNIIQLSLLEMINMINMINVINVINVK